MKKYVLIFKTSIRTILQRSHLISKLYQVSKDIKFATVDLDDEDFILRIESTQRNEDFISRFLLLEGHKVAFMAAFEKDEQGRPLAVSHFQE
ncbi:hypothetical protein [Sphingobacterium corticibacterium]|uniref:Uncharacterized protein n=1 Tax=Sphingobacterium corticibacterium TaxID=2484746 RepID=A0A4Q6XFD5_9SPHI|nr:hypothetical protein [Sphingobacterium corticibacterium]RZF58133.1 hypothetical protein EWE74_18950 [Sphingobacterium corticibacterium]